MEYNSTSRNLLYDKFIESHQPGGLTFGSKNKQVALAIMCHDRNATQADADILKNLHQELYESKLTPGAFYSKKYPKVVEFFAGGRRQAQALYAYFDKLNQFSYSTGWNRRTVRTVTYVAPTSKVRTILKAAYALQFYGCSLAQYVLNQMDEEKIDFKKYSHYFWGGNMEDLIAAYLDAGDKELEQALETIINSENNVAHLETYMIRGILKSDNKRLHQLLGQLLLAARLQEGLRQAICENMDCGTHAGFCELFKDIDENNLLRYTAVRRAVATWVGILDPDHLVRTSNKTFELMKECIYDRTAPKRLVKSDDAVSIVMGLWGMGLREVNDAIKVMIEFINSGTIQQKRVAAFFNHNLHDSEMQRKIANTVITNEAFDIEMAAAIFPTYMNNFGQEIHNAAGKAGYNQPRKEPRSVDLSIWFKQRETCYKHYAALDKLLSSMKNKNYQFNPFLFPWYFTNISRSNVLLRMCIIANGLENYDLMDSLADKIPELDGASMDRQKGVMLLLSRPKTPKLRKALIEALGDKETSTRREAFEIAQRTDFTPEEYDHMCSLLRFKAADLRKNIIALLKKQDSEGLSRSLSILLNDTREENRLAGLDILLTAEKDSKVYTQGINLVKDFSKPTEREQILINQLLGLDAGNIAEDEKEALYTENDNIRLPVLSCDKKDFPLFDITADELGGLFKKLDDLIYDHRNDEIKTVNGEITLLGSNQYLPIISYNIDPEVRTPLLHLWKEFYETEIKTPQKLMAMYLALQPYASGNSITGYDETLKQPYNQYLKSLMGEIFGKAIVDFDPTGYRFGRSGNVYNAKSGGQFFRGIMAPLKAIYCPSDYLDAIATGVVKYLCCFVPEDKRQGKLQYNTGNTVKKYVATPLNIAIISSSTESFMEDWKSKDQVKTKFDLLANLEELYDYDENRQYNNNRVLCLKALDYAVASFYGLITEGQMYKKILTGSDLRGNLQNLFMMYRVDRYPYLKRTLDRYGFDVNEGLNAYVHKVADEVADTILRVECKRGDSLTPYSKAVTSIEHVCGTNHMVQLLVALGKEKFVRSDHLSWNTKGDRKTCLSHLISVCHPLPGEDVETLKAALKGTSIKEKRLIETAMYAPQWLDMIEEYLGYEGLKSGCYYFMAHMNDQYSQNEKKNAIIARYTPLEKEELLGGAFDIEWFEEAYNTLGEKRFQLLYDAAKYISDGSKHSRARKYADACLGRVSLSELEPEIKDKRNKDLLMSYALVPLEGKDDMLHRYEFIQQFRKESQQFGSQRKASESQACDMALKNLSTRAGFRDVTRLTLAMEMELVKSLEEYFTWHALDEQTSIRIDVLDSGKPDVVVKKGEKTLSSIPTAFKKDAYVLELKETTKKFRSQYSRTVKMFELAMEEMEVYTFEELAELCGNPIIKPIVENLVYIAEDNTCGVIMTGKFVDVNGEVLGKGAGSQLRVAHPFDLYKSGDWASWQKVFFKKQQESGFKQPFRQVFRELYVKLDEEIDQPYSRMFAGHQIQPTKTVACLKGRRWIADHETGLGKIFYKDNIVVKMYALADWFAPSDIEAPTLEWVEFQDRKTFERLKIEDVPEIVYSEAMRDVDLAVSVAHAGGVDPEASHSTIEMRKVIAECNIDLFGLKNVRVEGNHALINGSLGEYSVHLGSGIVHMIGHHILNVLPVHSQHRGRVFLPFLDEDPKTAEIISKILLFADDKKIKDPYILSQME